MTLAVMDMGARLDAQHHRRPSLATPTEQSLDPDIWEKLTLVPFLVLVPFGSIRARSVIAFACQRGYPEKVGVTPQGAAA